MRINTGAPKESRLASPIAAVGTAANVTETTLQSFTLPANSLAVDGQAIRVVASGTMVGSTRSRTIKLYLGATVLATLTTAVATVTHWAIEATIVRTAAGAQRVLVFVSAGSGTADTVSFTNNAATAISLSADAIIKVTGQVGTGALANDITCNMMLTHAI